MSDPPDMDALARRYLDLWQQGISQAAVDPETARAIATIFAPFLAWMPPVPAAERASADDSLAEALARIERRLDRIEARLEAAEKPEDTQPAKRRSARTRKRS